MKRLVSVMLFSLLFVTVVLISGCSKREQNTATGAVIGTTAGAVIGGASGGTSGAFLGGALGGITGGLIGNSATKDNN